MNPFYRPAVCLGTIGALVVAANDPGKTSNPPSNPVAHLLTAASTTASIATVTMVANTAGVAAVYDTWVGRTRLPFLDSSKRPQG